MEFNKKEIFLELKNEVLNCRKCDLAQTRLNVVFGEGNIDADIMFVGEAPGKDEDEQGRPFVGAAGKLLTEMIESIGFRREDVFIGNILKCRPPQNRNPSAKEIEKCSPYLFAQISLILPKIICPLGNFALRTLLEDNNLTIGNCHGKVWKKNEIFFLPMYHPASYLHKKDENIKKIMFNDFKKLKLLFAKLQLT